MRLPRRPRPPSAAFDLRGTPAERRRLYRALADLLMAASPGALIAVERVASAPGPRLLLRPASIASALLAQPAVRPLVRPATFGAQASPPAHGRIAALLPGPSPPARAIVPPPSLDRTDPAEPAGRDGRVDVQTFWTVDADRHVWVARWIRLRGERVEARFDAVATAAAAAWGRALGVPVAYRETTWGHRAAWDRLAPSHLPRAAWTCGVPRPLEGTAEPEVRPGLGGSAGHALILGASGAGKTVHLADRAAAAIRAGRSVVALDLHGDLSAALAARLGPAARARVVGIDVTRPPFPGIAALDPRAPTERAVAHVVAALKRLTPDGAETYWGYRLERLLEAFVRLAHEDGGTLRDAYALLTDADRRDAARLTTRSAELARFLDELGPVVRRTPDFLWGAAARLAKVVSVPALTALLAPDDGGLPVEEILADGRSLVVRLPFAHLGPEAASFAASLVLGRLYFGSAAQGAGGGREILAVLDEVQALSPRLVAEIYAEGRKFGWRLVTATQYPERLAPELRAAAGADVDEIVAFRLAAPAASESAPWVGLEPAIAGRVLPALAPGAGVVLRRSDAEPLPVAPCAVPLVPGDAAWAEITATAGAGRTPTPAMPDEDAPETTSERVLLAVFAAREEGHPLAPGSVVDAVRRLPGSDAEAGTIDDRVGALRRERAIEVRDDGWALTPAGERRLGLGRPTGAVRESSEHRRLLLAAFRIFARRGYRLEVVRQGRFDLRLPDARFRQLSERERATGPEVLAAAVDRARRGWAWRYFEGRDVHVEAEVSGALRAERIRRGVAKARGRGAAVLFAVADLRRAARVRAVLVAEGIRPPEARVWVLPPTDPDRPLEGPAPRAAGGSVGGGAGS